MKLFSVAIYTKSPQVLALCSSSELSSFGYFQRSSVQEFMTFLSGTVVDRTEPGQRQSVEEEKYIGHVFVRSDELAGVIVSDQEYPARVAHSLLTKMLDEFSSSGNSMTLAEPWPRLDYYISSYQDPKQADKIMQVQNQLDDTKIVLHKTIESVLQRGEKLDDLVARSDALSGQSKMFYKTAKKTNSCCIVM
ncbi:Longin-like domain-containing protein [Piptocephalis cylindrospora]|uniref:Synaptobrevin homolog YKT6 n=1 Tax=Piptocephalis cylindrospora TaxID=1907219 RepID=A0A4P9Y0R1_9FUNG|nr:Longin-like domain-containing protein [Piptocephalis cylindrospora]|eukprot:RKP12343.1 Longin-like domain-containing protein [Piptocephalis cylindrospora]